MSKSPISLENPAMTKSEAKPAIAAVNELFSKSPDGLREIVRAVMQEMLEAEMTEALGAEKGERTAARLGYRSGYYAHAGHADRQARAARSAGPRRPVLDRVVRALSALGAGLGGGTGGDVRAGRLDPEGEGDHRGAVRPQLLGLVDQRHQQAIWTRSLAHFASRPLAEAFPYLILDARYERVREGGVILSQAVLIAIGIDWDGRPPGAGGRTGQPGEPLDAGGISWSA